jgi:trimeric autotransporter adhesin
MNTKLNYLSVALILLAGVHQAIAQGTAFTYQGRLNNGASLTSGSYDMKFTLYATNLTGNAIAGPVTNSAITVNNGLFTTTLDFGGGVFTGTNYWLDMFVRTNGASSFTELSPRQPVTPVPYAVMAESVNGPGLSVQQNTNGAPNVIGGSQNNSVSSGVVGATIGGGGAVNYHGASYTNRVAGSFGTVGGGAGNIASGYSATVGGGNENTASGTDATVSGGEGNTASDANATVAGGEQNVASINDATVGGGDENIARGAYATVGGGENNTASGFSATVGGGSANTASGDNATVAGGNGNTASGDDSFAAGSQAHAGHDGSFVWADNNSPFTFSSTTANQFRVRATGGVAFVTAIDGSGNVMSGVHLLSGDTAWSSISDKNAKKNFQPVNGKAVLEKLAVIPVEKWNYKWEADTNTPHIGPMAQDFKGAFYPGRDDKSISTLEFDGVELAAIQGLNQKVDELKTELNHRDAENAELKQRLDALEKIILHRDNHEPPHPSAL